VLGPWRGLLAAIVVTAVTAALVVLDIVDRDIRNFWMSQPLTTDTIAGLLVLAMTVLIVNQVLSRRQVTERSRAIAAQAGILLTQARRAVNLTLELRDGRGDRESASDGLQTYLAMLLVSAPLLIDTPVARLFLEQAQRLAAELARELTPSSLPAFLASSGEGGLDKAIDQLRSAATPLLDVLKADERSTVTSSLTE
jgi:hypothetical protein